MRKTSAVVVECLVRDPEPCPAWRGLLGRAYERWADGRRRCYLVPWRTRPHRRNGIDGGGHCIGSLLVVDPPADEVGPGVGGGAFDRGVGLLHPGDRVPEAVG